MSYDRAATAKALAAVLGDASPGVPAFDHPPRTINPPAYVLSYPSTVDYNIPAFSIDRVEQVVLCVAGMDSPEVVDGLVEAARDALAADSSLGGVVQVVRVAQLRNWRMVNVAGSDFLVAELALEVNM